MMRLLLGLLLATSACAQIAITNSASGAVVPLSPGVLATAYGAFTGVAVASAPSLPLPTTLNGVRVRVGDTDAPLLYVSATQVNFQVPVELAANNYPVTITVNNNQLTGRVAVIPASPALFVRDTNRRGVILNQDLRLNTQDNPARRGEAIVIYGTGFGPVTGGTLSSGAGAPANLTTTARPVVYIAGARVPDAQVEYSGVQAGFVGLWQINVRIPGTSFISGEVPLQLDYEGLPSNEVTFFVAQ